MLATCAPPMPNDRAPTPMAKNSLLYFLIWATDTKCKVIKSTTIILNFTFINNDSIINGKRNEKYADCYRATTIFCYKFSTIINEVVESLVHALQKYFAADVLR